MKDWFYEILTIFCFSKRTQWAVFFGFAGYIAISLLGHYMTNDFQLSGIFAPFTDMVRDKLLARYDKAALGVLGSFLLLAIKLYRKDRKRFYNY